MEENYPSEMKFLAQKIGLEWLIQYKNPCSRLCPLPSYHFHIQIGALFILHMHKENYFY